MTAETLDASEIPERIADIARRARSASLGLATLPTETKNRFLRQLADRLETEGDAILEANAPDLESAGALELAAPMVERLRFTPDKIARMAEGVRQVAALPDPVGEELERLDPPSGLDVRKVRVPLGVVGIIYESRPNVTVDCAALCLKSGNACILRGGREAIHSNLKLGEIIRRTLKECEIDEDAVQIIPTTDRWALSELLKHEDTVHCIIPRGGESLIRFVSENSRIPVIKHYSGNCNVYVDADADPDLAEKLVVDAKCQRPGVCNAAENLLVHRDAAPLLPRLARALHDRRIELRADAPARAALEGANVPLVDATEDDFRAEFLDRIIAITVVPDLEHAIAFVNAVGSGHSDAIITENDANARRFLAGVDSATVYHNASTRFTDGFEFGLGAEIGISTDRLHARGPMGLRELCTYKYVIHGRGETKA